MAVDLSAGLSSPFPSVDLSAGLVSDDSAPRAKQSVDLSAGLSSAPSARVDLSAGLGNGTQPNGSTLSWPDRVSIAPYQPSIWSRIKDVFLQGDPNYSTRTVNDPRYGEMQILTPEELMTPSQREAHPIATGISEFAGGMTSPTSVGLMAATGGLGELPGAASMLPRLMSAGFGIQSLRAAYQNIPAIREAWNRNDTSEVERLLTHTVLDVGAAALAGRHAATGKAGVSGRTTESTPAPAIETRLTEPHSPVSEVLHEPAPDVRFVDSMAAKHDVIAQDTVHDPNPWGNLKYDAEAQKQARSELGPDAEPRAVLARAQEIKQRLMSGNGNKSTAESPQVQTKPGELAPGLSVRSYPWMGKTEWLVTDKQGRVISEGHASEAAAIQAANGVGASEPAPANVAPLPTARIVADDHVPVVSRNEVLAQAISNMVANSGELQKIGIDPSRITSPADAEAMLQQAADHIKANLDPRASATLTFDVQKQLASDLGMSVEDLLSRKSGQSFNAEQAIAARSLLNDSGLNVVKAAQKAAADPSALSDMTTALAQHQAILDSVKGMTAEAGRALGSFKVQDLPASRIANAMSGLSEDAQAKAAALLAKIDPNNPRELNDFVEKITPSSTADKVFEFYRNSLLSGPATVIKKGVSEATMLALETTKKLVAAGLSKITGSDDQRFASESYWFAKGAIDAMQHAPAVLTGQFDLADAPGFENTGLQAIKGIAGDIVRFPSEVLKRQTNLMYLLNFMGELNSQAARQAISEGLTGAELAARQEYLSAHPTDAMTKAANDTALHNTFQKELGKFAKKGQSFIQSDPTGALRYLVPFFRTPINIAKEAGYYSPYGFFKGLAQGDLDMQARGIVGSSIAAGIGFLALNNYISGGGPIDTRKRQTLESSGWQPYSVRIGDRWISYRRAEPLGLSLALVADTVHGMKMGDSAEVTNSKVDTALAHIGRSLQDVAFVPTVASLSEAITNPDGRARNFISRQVASFVPALSKDVAQAVDPTVRKPNGIVQTLEARTPGLTSKVPAVIDVDGRPVQRPASAVGGANPFPITRASNDPVMRELARLGIATSQPPTSIKWRGKPTQLLDSERQWLAQQEGEQLHTRLSRVVTTPAWQDLTDVVKRQRVREIRRDIEQSRPQRISKFLNQTQARLTAGSL
jgi:hypothetical protein